MPFISVIIPVYNVEKYLRDCIESVLQQSFSDIEIILVEDGSPDDSPKICDEYSKKDGRVKVIHKENGGLSDARNVGIDMATGKYIMFLDSDDYWSGSDCLCGLTSNLRARECDVLVHGCVDYSCVTGKETISRMGYDHQTIASKSKKEVLEYFFSSGKFPGSAWITVTRREFLVKNNLYFQKGIKAEDIDWLLNVFLHADKFSSIDDCLYIYRKYRNDSITGTANLKSINDILWSVNKWLSIIKKDEYLYIKDYVNSHLAYQYFTAIVIYNKLASSDKRKVKELMLEQKPIFENLKNNKVKAAAFIYNFLGLGISSKLFFLYHNFKKCR